MEIMSLKPTGGHCYNLVTGSGANCNTWNISTRDRFRKYSIDGIQPTKHKDSKPGVKSAQELITTFGKMTNEAS